MWLLAKPDYIQSPKNKSIPKGNISTWGFSLSQENFDSCCGKWPGLCSPLSKGERQGGGKNKTKQEREWQVKNRTLSGATEFQINQEWEVPNFSQQEGLSVGACGLGEKTEKEKVRPRRKNTMKWYWLRFQCWTLNRVLRLTPGTLLRKGFGPFGGKQFFS